MNDKKTQSGARVIRVYADTSVFGGMHDEEFAEPTKIFFEQVREGRFRLVTSAVVREELTAAPERVRRLFDEMARLAEVAGVTEDGLRLQQGYLDAGILTPNWETDALHVALASVSRCAVIVSWNFHHIVHFQKIPLYNAVNRLHGFPELGIYSPREVIQYENEDEVI